VRCRKRNLSRRQGSRLCFRRGHIERKERSGEGWSAAWGCQPAFSLCQSWGQGGFILGHVDAYSFVVGARSCRALKKGAASLRPYGRKSDFSRENESALKSGDGISRLTVVPAGGRK
jgi:hypothetical protein